MGLKSLLKKLFSEKKDDGLVKLFIKDKKCGNNIKVVLRKNYDIQRVYDDNQESVYQINKFVVCDNCYNKIKIHVGFDKKYNIIRQEIDNGQFIEETEF